MAHFEKVSRFDGEAIAMPVRKTASSAGYDFVVAEDTIIPSYDNCLIAMNIEGNIDPAFDLGDVFNAFFGEKKAETKHHIYTLDEVAAITKKTKAKPTLVSTGMKCKLDPGTYLELSVRSSSPLKYWLVLANGVGIIDADYYNNPDNEGEIFFQLINLSPFDIKLQKGETIGQGIIKPYLITEDDAAAGERTGGFGSTGA